MPFYIHRGGLAHTTAPEIAVMACMATDPDDRPTAEHIATALRSAALGIFCRSAETFVPRDEDRGELLVCNHLREA